MKALMQQGMSLKEQKAELLRQVDVAIKAAPKTKKDITLPGSLGYELDLHYARVEKAKSEGFIDPVVNGVQMEYDLYDASLAVFNNTHKYMSTSKDFVAIGIPDGVTYHIMNREGELEKFRGKLKSMFSIPPTRLKDTKYIPLIPKPSAHRVENIGILANMKQKEWWCDGNIAVKGAPPARAKLPDPKSGIELDMEHVIPKATYSASFICYGFNDPEVGYGVSLNPIPRIMNGSNRDGKIFYPYPPVVMFESRGEKYIYNQWYFSVIRNRFPDAIYEMDEGGMLVACIGGEIVALLMHIRDDGNAIAVYEREAVRLLKGNC